MVLTLQLTRVSNRICGASSQIEVIRDSINGGFEDQVVQYVGLKFPPDLRPNPYGGALLVQVMLWFMSMVLIPFRYIWQSKVRHMPLYCPLCTDSTSCKPTNSKLTPLHSFKFRLVLEFFKQLHKTVSLYRGCGKLN